VIEHSVRGKREILKVGNVFYFHSNIKPMKIIDATDTPLTKEEAKNIVQSALNSGMMFTSSTYASNSSLHIPSYTSLYDKIKFVSYTQEKVISARFEEVDKIEALNLAKQGYYEFDMGTLVLQKNNKCYVINHPNTSYSQVANPWDPNRINLSEVRLDIVNGILTPVSAGKSNNYYGRAFNTYSNIDGSIDDFDKFFKIIKIVGKEEYI
jgi:hypothetical protein